MSDFFLSAICYLPFAICYPFPIAGCATQADPHNRADLADDKKTRPGHLPDAVGLCLLRHRQAPGPRPPALPGCGAPQGPERRYFPSDQDKVAVEDHQFVGADWQCAACESPNASGADFCVNCGTGQEEGASVMRRADQVAAEGESFAEDSVEQARKEAGAHRRAEREARQAEYETRRAAAGDKSVKGAGKGGGKSKTLLILGVVVIAILILIFWKKSATMTVDGHTWSRAVNIERFQTAQDSKWCDDMPGGAYRVTRRREKSGTRRVEDGETCRTVQQDQGDGTFKEVEECSPRYREEDVFDQKCYFSVDKWVQVRTETASGASLAETPHWPDLRLEQTGRRLGAEREGERSDHYIVTFRTEDGETHECAFSEDKWRTYSVGQTLEVKVGGVTGNLRCSSL